MGYGIIVLQETKNENQGKAYPKTPKEQSNAEREEWKERNKGRAGGS